MQPGGGVRNPFPAHHRKSSIGGLQYERFDSLSGPPGAGRPLTMASLFDDNFLRSFFNMSDFFNAAAFRVDVKDKGDRYQIAAELPGVPRDQIELSVEDGVLTVAADMNVENKQENENYIYSERRTGHFQRCFNLDGIQEDKITATYKDGVLTIDLPKQQPEPKKTQRRIQIH